MHLRICLGLAGALAMPAVAATISPNDDTWTYNLSSTTNYDQVDGIKIRWTNYLNITRYGWLEFTLGTNTVSQATFYLNNPIQGAGVALTMQLKGAEYSFDETTLTWATQPDTSGWADLGTFVWGPAGNDIGWFSVDITGFYNSNLGKTVTIRVASITQSDNAGPVFEDREGTQLTTNYPYIEYVEGGLPTCESAFSPGTNGTATAYRNQPATPSSFPYQIANTGSNTINYTAVEMARVAPAISDLYGTGLDNSRLILGEQVLDPHWTIIGGGLAGTCAEGTPCPAYTVPADGFPIPPWLPNDSTSLWITASQTDGDAVAPAGDHVFRTTFTLADQATVDAAQILGRVACDNTLVQVTLNGALVVEGTGAVGFLSWQDFTIDSGFQIGTNTLDFRVTNTGTGANPMGLRVEFYDVGPQDVSWLDVDNDSDSLASLDTDPINVSVVNTDLPNGTYFGYVKVSDDCDPAVSYMREFQLTVIDCLSEVTPAGNTGRAFRLGTAQTPAPVSYAIENAGVADINYTIETSGDCSWLELDKTGGSLIGQGSSDTITGTIDTTGLEAGGYVCTLTFSDECNPAGYQIRQVLLSVDETITDAPSGLQQFNAEFTTFTGSDLTAESPLESCDPSVTTDRKFLVGGEICSPGTANLLPDWLTQGSIAGTPTTARFYNPEDGTSRGRARFRAFLPYDNSFDPAKGMIVAWRMMTSSEDNIGKGPIQITFPRVAGPFNTSCEISSVDGEVFNAYIRVRYGTEVRILNNSGGSISSIDQLNLASSVDDAYHQWTASVCYNATDDMSYWNLWLDSEKLMFSGANGSVVGPGGDVFSFRLNRENVTGDPYIGLGENLSNDEDEWIFEFDWVRMASLNVTGAPFWDGEGCVAAPACPVPFADADADGDVDQMDFADFQLCFTGAGDQGGHFDSTACGCYDRDHDGDVDALDFGAFEECASGPGVPWQPSAECP